MLVVPNTIVPAVLKTSRWPALVAPSLIKKASPLPKASGSDGAAVSVSVERVSTHAVDPSPTVVTVYTPFCVWVVWKKKIISKKA